MGCGTLAYDAETDTVLPHIHTSLGERARPVGGKDPVAFTVTALAEHVMAYCAVERTPGFPWPRSSHLLLQEAPPRTRPETFTFTAYQNTVLSPSA